MKKNHKRRKMLLAFSLIATLLSAQIAFADNSSDSTVNISNVVLDTNPVSEREAVDVAGLNQANVLQEVGIEVVDGDASLKANQIHREDYGGSYIDADGNVNVLLVDGSASLRNIENDRSRDLSKKIIRSAEQAKDNKDVKIQSVKFSEADLYTVKGLVSQSLSSLSRDLEIRTVAVDTSLNKVVVGLGGSKDVDNGRENAVNEFVSKYLETKIKDVKDALSFEYVGYGSCFTDCVLITPVTESPITTSSATVSSTTTSTVPVPFNSELCAIKQINGVIYNVSATVGYPVTVYGGSCIVSAGHAFDYGAVIWAGSSTNTQCAGGVIVNNYNANNYYIYDDSCIIGMDPGVFTSTYPVAVQTSCPLMGASILQGGYVSGEKTSIVQQTSVDIPDDVNNRMFMDVVLTSVPSQSGDSGGPLYNRQYLGSALTNLVYGIVEGNYYNASTHVTSTVFIKSANIHLS